MVFLLVAALAGSTVWAGDLPNVFDDRDLEAMTVGVCAGLAQVVEADEGALLWEIAVLVLPQLAGEANGEPWSSGPTFFMTLWSPKFGDAFGFVRVEGETVTLGTAAGYEPARDGCDEPTSTWKWSCDNGAVRDIILDDDRNVIGVVPESFCLARPDDIGWGVESGGLVLQGNSAHAFVCFGNYAASRNSTVTALAPYPVGEVPEGRGVGEPFVAAFLELDVPVLVETACPSLSQDDRIRMLNISDCCHSGTVTR